MSQDNNPRRSIYLPLDLWNKVGEVVGDAPVSQWIRVAILRRLKEQRHEDAMKKTKNVDHKTDAELLADLVAVEIEIHMMDGGQFCGGTTLMDSAMALRHEVLRRMKGGD